VDDTDNLLPTGYAIGDAFTVIMLADESLGGTRTYSDGTVVTVIDSFFIDYIGGSALPEFSGVTSNIVEQNFAFTTSGEFNGNLLAAGNRLDVDASASVSGGSPVGLPSTWVLADNPAYGGATQFVITQRLEAPDSGSDVYIYGILAFTAASSTNPVPVPAAVWLFGSGLLGLVGIARRKKA